ncbi:S9 family peptidase [Brevundimonas sp. 2R-24]|uniref:S9 family peptidase n=1 Tax=Peiella sedimenti TaxID=3061083 RepID=A0ABT8SLA7_9CAUL|nr:S9 family peptidase [Caulobacteraceae bacterium XZ-24]
MTLRTTLLACAAFALLPAAAFAQSADQSADQSVAQRAMEGVPEGPHPFSIQDLVRLDRVSDPQVSPDGRWVVYQVRATDLEANRGVVSLWRVPVAGGEPQRLAVSDGGANTARWASNGRLYFLSSRSGSSQVWVTDADGATARQVTDLPLDVSTFRIAPGGQNLVVALEVYPACEADLACTAAEVEHRAARVETGRIYDRVFVRHWDTWEDGRKNHLFSLALNADGMAEGAARPLMRGFDGDAPSVPFGDDTEFTVSPDGARVVFAAREAGRTEPWSTDFDLYETAIDGSTGLTNLTEDNPAWDTGAAFSPDGRRLAWRAMSRPGFEADRFRIMLRDLRTGATREVAPNWDRSADAIAWSRDGRWLFAVAQDVGSHRVFRIDPRTGGVTPVTGPGSVGSISVADGRVVYDQARMNAPADVWVAPILTRQAPMQLTRHNAERLEGVAMGDYEQFSFAGWNGETVHGYVVKPANYQPGRRYPVAFLVHGGPQGSFGDAWSYRWNPQTYAGAGYAVVMIDFHGSVGYGQAFTDSISQHWGDRPLEDLQKGWAHVLSTYDFLDGDRACALGASYGGYMVNWMAGVWNEPWKCFVSHDGIFDTRAMGLETEELWFTEWENGGTLAEAARNYDQFNPINHIANWRVPTLVVHGGRDYRVPETQGLAVFNALQRQGVESRLLYFPNENHWVLKPRNSIQWHDTVEDWLDRWIGD